MIAAMSRLLAILICGTVTLSCKTKAPVTTPSASPASQAVSVAPTTTVSVGTFTPVENMHLHNAYTVTPNVFSGAQPDGDAAFGALKDLGIKTILSVDGASPDVAAAGRYGMRYVHMPMGYDGLSEADGQAIAKALIELPGPIYVHCHHGKHRSAAAVAVACVYNGQLKPEQAEDVLKTFGTGKNYKGLWAAARNARPLDPQVLRDLKVEYVEVRKIGDLAEMMVAVDKRMDLLKLLNQNRWALLADHPDLDPQHEALQMQEHLIEIGRLESVDAYPESFRKLLVEGEYASQSLHDALSTQPFDLQAANNAYTRLSTSCTACHIDYRD